MNYEELLCYRKEAGKKQGMVLGLSRMKRLMELLGNPQDTLSYIHIAGTNGKGSTAAYLEQVLLEAGYRTGKYTSPAVFDFREQYQADGNWIKKEEAAACMTKIAKAADEIEKTEVGRPTVFEQETALAFVWFAQKKCELVVLETGIGGDEDATNIVTTTVCSVLTPISLEHKRILGTNLAEIAGHKAGIIKPGIPVVSYKQKPEAMEIIEKQCESLKARLVVSRPESAIIKKITSSAKRKDGSGFPETGMMVSYKEWNDLYTSQQALWQADNIAVVLETIAVLGQVGYRITKEAAEKGIARMKWRGRFEVVKGSPAFVIDGAHNPDGAKALRESLDFWFPKQKRVFVMGVLGDKEYSEMIRILFAQKITREQIASESNLTDNGKTELPKTDTAVYTVMSDSPRALSAEKLAAAVCAEFPKTEAISCLSVKEAVKKAADRAGKDGIVVVCGSLSFMKELYVARQCAIGGI